MMSLSNQLSGKVAAVVGPLIPVSSTWQALSLSKEMNEIDGRRGELSRSHIPNAITAIDPIHDSALRLDRHHLYILNPTLRREPPDADVPAAQVAVGVPVERGRGAFVVDLFARPEQAQRFSDA